MSEQTNEMTEDRKSFDGIAVRREDATMNRKATILRSGLAVAAALGLALGVGCSSTPTVEDPEPEPELTEIEEISKETGISVQALEMFEEAGELMDAGELVEASELLAQVVEDEPYFAEAHYNLGLVYGDIEQHDLAVEHIERARDLEPEVFDYTIAMAKAHAEAGEYSDARRLFNEVIQREPGNLTAINNLAVISLREGDEQQALDYVEEILREDNDNVGALNTLGLIYMERENISLARFVLGRALEQDDSNPDVHNNLGLVYLQDDNVPSAVRHFNLAVEADPNYLESRINLGSILIEYLDYDRADEHFSHVVNLTPENCVANLGKGATSFAKGEHEEARDRFEYYLEMCDSDHYSSHERLATLNEGPLENPAQAIEHYEALLALSTDEDDQAQYEAEINFLQSQMERQAQPDDDES